MIFRLHKDFLQNVNKALLSDACVAMADNAHYIDADADSFEIVKKAIQTHASSTQKAIWTSFVYNLGYNVPASYKEYLTTIDVVSGYDIEKLIYLANNKAVVFMENGPYEWPIYCHMVKSYHRNKKYGRAFELLKIAIKNKRIYADQTGGTGQLDQIYDFREPAEPQRSWLNEKSMCLFDRDTDNDSYFNKDHDKLFLLLCGKDHTTLTNADIYTLSQNPPRWHMWYRRAIENYIDRAAYIKHKVNMDPVPEGNDYYYYNIANKKKTAGGGCKKYNKSNLKNIAKEMTMKRFEDGLKQFFDGETSYSELQLFLLKLVKII